MLRRKVLKMATDAGAFIMAYNYRTASPAPKAPTRFGGASLTTLTPTPPRRARRSDPARLPFHGWPTVDDSLNADRRPVADGRWRCLLPYRSPGRPPALSTTTTRSSRRLASPATTPRQQSYYDDPQSLAPKAVAITASRDGICSDTSAVCRKLWEIAATALKILKIKVGPNRRAAY